MEKTNSAYSLQILLPNSISQKLDHWANHAAGATIPASGWHITLLGDFVLLHGLKEIEQAVEAVGARYKPFVVCLDQVTKHMHWLRPHLDAVLLVNETDSEAQRTLLRFQRELSKALAPLKKDAYAEMANRRYNPHVSLTWGLPKPEARRLVHAARAAKLEVEFTVEEIWLLEIIPSSSQPQLVKRGKSFKLGLR